jgi:hypothetical protein
MPQLVLEKAVSRPYLIAATGSRKTRVTPGLVERLDEFLADNAHTHDLMVISGMAEGWDELVARRCVVLGIPLIAALPNPGCGAYYWSAKGSLSGQDRTGELDDLLAAAASVRYICGGLYRNMAGVLPPSGGR